MKKIWLLFLAAWLTVSATNARSQNPVLKMSDEQNTVEIFNRSRPAVVHINARQKIPLKYEDITHESGVETGFFFDRQHILTNFHVIKESNQIEVVLVDGRRLNTRLVGTAPGFDLTVLAVDTPDLDVIPLPLGDSDQLVIGQKVLAVGHPLALHNTLTVGIVSALRRTLSSLSPELEGTLIQTDAAINPGNSGGPLMNSSGEVIGIVTAVMAGAQNLGFAVPSNIAKQVIPDLLRMGHPYMLHLGFNGVSLNRYLSNLFGIPLQEGFLVADVAHGSPAQRAGLRAGIRAVAYGERVIVLGGDIITAVNGKKVTTLGKIELALLSGQPAQTVILTVYRDGQNHSVEFALKPMH